jgi:DNA-directed RNA polymerase
MRLAKQIRVKKMDFFNYKFKSAPSRQVIFTELDFKNLRKALKFVIFVD